MSDKERLTNSVFWVSSSDIKRLNCSLFLVSLSHTEKLNSPLVWVSLIDTERLNICVFSISVFLSPLLYLWIQMLSFLGGEGSSFSLEKDQEGRFVSRISVTTVINIQHLEKLQKFSKTRLPGEWLVRIDRLPDHTDRKVIRSSESDGRSNVTDSLECPDKFRLPEWPDKFRLPW